MSFSEESEIDGACWVLLFLTRCTCESDGHLVINQHGVTDGSWWLARFFMLTEISEFLSINHFQNNLQSMITNSSQSMSVSFQF